MPTNKYNKYMHDWEVRLYIYVSLTLVDSEEENFVMSTFTVYKTNTPKKLENWAIIYQLHTRSYVSYIMTVFTKNQFWLMHHLSITMKDC